MGSSAIPLSLLHQPALRGDTISDGDMGRLDDVFCIHIIGDRLLNIQFILSHGRVPLRTSKV